MKTQILKLISTDQQQYASLLIDKLISNVKLEMYSVVRSEANAALESALQGGSPDIYKSLNSLAIKIQPKGK